MISIATIAIKFLASRAAGWLAAAVVLGALHIATGQLTSALRVERAAVARLKLEAYIRNAADAAAEASTKVAAEADAANAAAETDLQRVIDNAPLVAQCTTDDFMRRLRNVR